MKALTIRNGKHAWGSWISTDSPVVAEIAGQYPFDWLLIDFEHGAASEAVLPEIVRGISHCGAAIIIRVPELLPGMIARVLDWGADGIMLPHVRSAEEAASCVAAMRYPPYGTRGYSSSVRAYGYGTVPPVVPSDVRPLFFAQIEDLKGVEHAEAIAAVDGVDVLFVGPADLKLGLSTIDSKNKPTYEQALKRVVNAAKNHGKRPGILVRDHQDISVLRESGFSCMAIDSDIAILRKGYERIMQTLPK